MKLTTRGIKVLWSLLKLILHSREVMQGGNSLPLLPKNKVRVSISTHPTGFFTRFDGILSRNLATRLAESIHPHCYGYLLRELPRVPLIGGSRVSSSRPDDQFCCNRVVSSSHPGCDQFPCNRILSSAVVDMGSLYPGIGLSSNPAAMAWKMPADGTSRFLQLTHDLMVPSLE